MHHAPWFAAFSLLLAVGACSRTGPPPTATPPLDPTVAIVNATLWDATGRPPVPNAVTLVRGERIVCAGALGECSVPLEARVIDAEGGWLIPGLIDSHVHLLFLRRGSTSADFASDLKDLLAQGITAVRDMGTDPVELLRRTRALAAAPRVYPMQLVAGFRFFYGRETVNLADGSTAYRLPPASVMQLRGWTPVLFRPGDDPDAVVAKAQEAGAVGLKLYAYLDSAQVRGLVEAAHRAGMPVWGHAWVQPANPGELARAGEDGLVHASLFIGDLFSPAERNLLLGNAAILEAGARTARPQVGLDPRIAATLDAMARRGVFFEPTLDVTLRSIAHYDAEHATRPSISENYARATVGFSMAVAREAVKRGVRLVAGTDHVAYGPVRDRASLVNELQLLVDSIGLSPAAALQAATRDAALAIGGNVERQIGTIEAGRYADLVLLRKSPLDDIQNLESVVWVMKGGQLWRPWQLRSGIAGVYAPPRANGNSSRSAHSVHEPT